MKRKQEELKMYVWKTSNITLKYIQEEYNLNKSITKKQCIKEMNQYIKESENKCKTELVEIIFKVIKT